MPARFVQGMQEVQAVAHTAAYKAAAGSRSPHSPDTDCLCNGEPVWLTLLHQGICLAAHVRPAVCCVSQAVSVYRGSFCTKSKVCNLL